VCSRSFKHADTGFHAYTSLNAATNGIKPQDNPWPRSVARPVAPGDGRSAKKRRKRRSAPIAGVHRARHARADPNSDRRERSDVPRRNVAEKRLGQKIAVAKPKRNVGKSAAVPNGGEPDAPDAVSASAAPHVAVVPRKRNAAVCADESRNGARKKALPATDATGSTGPRKNYSMRVSAISICRFRAPSSRHGFASSMANSSARASYTFARIAGCQTSGTAPMVCPVLPSPSSSSTHACGSWKSNSCSKSKAERGNGA